MPQITSADLPSAKLSPDELAIWIPGESRGLAVCLVEDGLAALPGHGGANPAVRRIVIRKDPGLDDALAASYARRLLQGVPLPACAEPLASYAALVRSGIPPNAVHAEYSLHAFFQAVRRLAGNDLTRPDIMARFQDGWSRLECAVITAFAAGADPLESPLLGSHPAFVRERAYLGRDRSAYVRDAKNGQRWIVRLPGRMTSSSGLFLTKPESFLHATWSRRDEGAPADSRYSFLAVELGGGHWELSVDPLDRTSLQPLALRLRELEQAGKGAAEAGETWSDGADIDGVLITSPTTGSVIPREKLLSVLRDWLHAQDAPASSFTSRLRSTWRLPRR